MAARTASPRQVELILDLSQQLADMDPESVATTITREDAAQLPGKVASAVITGMIERCKKLRAQRRTAARAAVEDKLEEEGFYRLDGTVYRTRRAKGSGRLYALRVVDTGHRVTLESAPGILVRLTPAAQLSDDEALALAEHIGRSTGQCIICGRKLTTPKSRAAGIGPVCRKNV